MRLLVSSERGFFRAFWGGAPGTGCAPIGSGGPDDDGELPVRQPGRRRGVLFLHGPPQAGRSGLARSGNRAGPAAAGPILSSNQVQGAARVCQASWFGKLTTSGTRPGRRGSSFQVRQLDSWTWAARLMARICARTLGLRAASWFGKLTTRGNPPWRAGLEWGGRSFVVIRRLGVEGSGGTANRVGMARRGGQERRRVNCLTASPISLYQGGQERME